MDRKEIRKELEDIFGTVNEDLVSVNDISEETSIREELALDSLQIAELLFAIEERFGVKIPDEEARGIGTVRNPIDLIRAKSQEGAEPPSHT